MLIDYLTEAHRLSGELSALRREFHQYPELGNHEFKTADRIELFLKELGIPTKRILETAVMGQLKGALPGPSIALRADMDALPLQEETGIDYPSRIPGIMHACGHDVHITAVLGAAKLLSGHREELEGTILLLFQPDEEGNGGAQRMIRAGVLEGVSAVFGAHVTPELPAGHIGVRYGKFYAASDTFKITVTGKSAHGAEREKGIDALAAASEIVGGLLELQHYSSEKSVITVGTFHGGTAGNIVADRAELTGIIRTLGPEARKQMRTRVLETVRDTAAKSGAQARCELHESYPGVVNDGSMTQLVEEAARSVFKSHGDAWLGSDLVHVIEEPLMMTEDFGYFLQERPGSFYHIGAGCPLPLHNPGFLPDEKSIVTAAAVHAAVAVRGLSTFAQ
ncbi:MAG: amidohydrolase [Fretibacterium sp.]|nr:amidohydrolase [Fretibacterium sp.]